MADEFLSDEEEAEPAEGTGALACEWCRVGAVEYVKGWPQLQPMVIVARGPSGSVAEWCVCPDCYLALLQLKAQRAALTAA